jgi:transcription elongation factor Elf1
LPTAQQFICKKCTTLSNVVTFEKTTDGVYYARCEDCGAKNKVVKTGASPSSPGLLPVTGLIR